MMVTGRGLDVLRAIVRTYVDTKEPVASKTLVENEYFDVSAATIRNEMANLEEAELIAAQHTSSGRVPTDKGYRLFVDRIEELKKLKPAEKRAIESFLEQSVDMEDLLGRSVRILSSLTNQLALVQYPSLGNAKVRHIELIQFAKRNLLVVLITDSGRVEQRMLELDELTTPEFLIQLRDRINEITVGIRLEDIPEILREVVTEVHPDQTGVVGSIVSSLIEQVNANRKDKLFVAGSANLAKSESDFAGSIIPILEAVEEQVLILRLFNELDEIHGVVAQIGREKEAESLSETSVIAGNYEFSRNQTAAVGLLGPTRMDYPGNFAAVEAVAKYLSKLIGEQQ